jgi:hydroxymethylbilane synthase
MAMARIVLGNRDGALALRQAREVLEQLTDEWPDVNFALRTIKNNARKTADGNDPLVQALMNGDIGVAVAQLETLPLALPEEVTLAAVARRLEPRTALVTKGTRALTDLPRGARVGVLTQRDAAYLAGQHLEVEAVEVAGTLEVDLKLLTSGELDGLLVPAATLIALDHRNRLDNVLEPEAFAPAPGQGAVGLLVRADDDLAFEVAYSLQHRPSFDRVRAERSFAHALRQGAETGDACRECVVGALANVTDDGELTLFGAVLKDRATLQASVSGEAKEADELGRELAQDVRRQLAEL